jgi:hypothetical protein
VSLASILYLHNLREVFLLSKATFCPLSFKMKFEHTFETLTSADRVST